MRLHPYKLWTFQRDVWFLSIIVDYPTTPIGGWLRGLYLKYERLHAEFKWQGLRYIDPMWGWQWWR